MHCSTLVNITETTQEEEVREQNIIRGSEPYEIDDTSLALNLDIIHTDNINLTGHIINDSYPLLQDKHWQIIIPSGCRMRLVFRVFDLESSFACKKDYFAVQTRANQSDIPKFCHHLQEIEIQRRRVQLTMHSDEDTARMGIYATACITNLPEDTADDQAPCTCRRNLPMLSSQSELSGESNITGYFSSMT